MMIILIIFDIHINNDNTNNSNTVCFWYFNVEITIRNISKTSMKLH